MVQAWYMDDVSDDKQAPHHKNPPEFINVEDVTKLTGVKYYKMNLSTFETDGSLDQFRAERSFSFEDEITCTDSLGRDLLEKFWVEHLHTDEEIRLVLEGSAYFDVRDGSDRWIRIQVVAGDLVVLPSGAYHRFTLDHNNLVKLKRFHVGEPSWVAYSRPAADRMPCREDYSHKLSQNSDARAQAC